MCAPHVLFCHFCHCLLFSELTFPFSHLCQKSYLLLIPDHHLLLGDNLFCFVIHTVFYLQLINFCFIVLLFIYFSYLLYLLNLSSKTLNLLTFGPRLKCLLFLSLFYLLFPLFLHLLFSLFLVSDYYFVQPSVASPRCSMSHKKINPCTPNPRSSKIWIQIFCSDSFLPKSESRFSAQIHFFLLQAGMSLHQSKSGLHSFFSG